MSEEQVNAVLDFFECKNPRKVMPWRSGYTIH